jgi:hypothetical protein
MNDWSDTGECHDNDGIHRSSGRIYRIVYDGPEKGEPTTERPEWLTQRGKGEVTAAEIEELLQSPDEAKQAMGVRWFGENLNQLPSETSPLRVFTGPGMVRSGLVRLEMAASLQRLPQKSRLSIANILCWNTDDATDRQLSLMVWYGIADVVSKYPDEAVELALASELPTVTRLITRRLAEDLEKTPGPVNELLSRVSDENRLSILRGLNEALRGWSQAPKPAAWDTIAKTLGDEETQTLIRELSVVFGDVRARDVPEHRLWRLRREIARP